MIADINVEAAKATVVAIVERAGQALAVRADISSVEDARATVRQAVERFGQLDILLNNAGIFPFAPPWS